MNIWELKESDVLYVQREAILQSASCFDISNPELMDNIELLNLIQEGDAGLFALLENFCTTYWNYYYFIHLLAPYEKRNGLSDLEKEKLSDYTHEKEESKRILLERLQEMKMLKG
jgi:hypothetical protein